MPKSTGSAPKPAAKKPAQRREQHPYKINGKDWNRDLVMPIVCAKIATCTLSIASILQAGHDGNTLPGYLTFMTWLQDDEALANQYASAKAAQAEYMAEEMLEIADDGRNDYMQKFGKDGTAEGWAVNGENSNRSRLRVETRKWLLGKLKPKKYGEKLQVGGDPDGVPIQTVSHIDLASLNLSKEELIALKALRAKLTGAKPEEGGD